MHVNNKIISNLFVIILIVTLSIIYSAESVSTVVSKQEKTPIYSVKTIEKKIALTFDVNWAENEYLYDILNVLNKYNAKATFFIMGGWVNYADENKEKLSRIARDGHEIGNHSYIHPDFTTITESRIKEEIEKSNDAIYKITGITPKTFRFPSGSYNERCLQYVRSLGYQCIQWSVDSIDYRESGADIEFKRVMEKVKEGSIVLFHNNAKYTPENLERILEALTESGYKFVTISDLLYSEEYYINENGEQIKNNY